MAEKIFTWTVDVETGWGGRTYDTEGIDKGLPLILKLFREHDIRGLFFVNTEVLENRLGLVSDILNGGHEIGNHGHFHTVFKEDWRAYQNKTIADNILKNWTQKQFLYYRAPKFSFTLSGQKYSDPKGHIGLLKQMWFGGEIPRDPIFYLHPFDILGGKHAPNLFCKLWYSRPRKAYETLINLVTQYPGANRLHQNIA